MKYILGISRKLNLGLLVWGSGMLRNSFIFLIYLMVLQIPMPVTAQTRAPLPVPHAPIWWGTSEDLAGKTPDEACRKDHDDLNPDAPYFPPEMQSEAVYACKWLAVQEEGGAGNTVLPNIVFAHCKVDYYYRDGMCRSPDTERPICDCTDSSLPVGALPNLVLGDPVDVSTGHEVRYDKDYESADGLLSIQRRYVSTNYSAYDDPFVGFGQAWQGLIPGRLYIDPDFERVTYGANKGSSSLTFDWTGDDASYNFVTSDYVRRANLTIINKPKISKSLYFQEKSKINGGAELKLLFSNGEYILYRRASAFGGALQGGGRFAVPVQHGYATGYKINYVYQDDGYYPSSAYDNHGRKLDFLWQTVSLQPGVPPSDGDPRYKVLKSVKLPAGGSLEYKYDEARWASGGAMVLDMGGRFDRLISVKRLGPSGAPLWVKSYLYENGRFPYALTGVLDTYGHRISAIEYDQSGLVKATQLANGLDRYEFDSYILNYDDGSYNDITYRDVKNPLGHVTHFEISRGYGGKYDASHPSIFKVTALPSAKVPGSEVYLSTDRLVPYSITDGRGTKTNYEYAGIFGRPSTITEAAELSEQRKAVISWHDKFDLPVKEVVSGLTTTYTYGAVGQILTITKTDTTSQTVPYSTRGQSRTWTYVWNDNGTLASLNGPKAAINGQDDITSYGYDSNGNLQTITNPFGQITRFGSFDADGRPSVMTDANGVNTNFAYDALGRPTTFTVKNPTDTALDRTTALSYDLEGRVISVTQPGTDPLIFDYDLAGRLSSVRMGSGERIDYERNAMGGVISETVKRIDGSVRSTVVRVFDELNRVVQLTKGPGRVSNLQYDANGNIVQLQLARSNATSFAFDGLDRLVNSVASDNGKVSANYNARDAITSFTDPIAVKTTFVRNGFGEVIREVSPDRGVTTYYRDAAGDVTAQIDARNQRIDIVRDLIGRIIQRTPVNRPASELVYYTYDSCGSAAYLIGRLACMTDGTGVTAFRYNFAGDLIEKRQVIGASRDAVLGYLHDQAGRIVEIRYPSGMTVSYTRDSKGRVITVRSKASEGASWTTLASSMGYEAFGALNALTYGNGLTLAMDWGNDDRLYGKLVQSGVKRLWATRYRYDGDDNIVGIDDLIDAARSGTYGYDGENRMIFATGSFGSNRRYDYILDKNGNRTALEARNGESDSVAASTTSFTRVNGGNRLVSIGSGSVARTIGYDARGNTVSEARPGGITVNVSYDGYGRLINYTRSDQPVQDNSYNGLDDRVVATSTNAGVPDVRRFVYDAGGRVMGEYGVDANDVKGEFIWLQPEQAENSIFSTGDGLGGYGILAVAVGAGERQKIEFVSTSHLGTPVLTTDMSGQIIKPGDYSSIVFPGQTKTLSDLYYNRYRDYDPTLGRYIQADPIGLEGGSNPYTYAANNPMRWTDPQGKIIPVALCAIGASAGAAGQIIGSGEFNWKHAAVAGGVGCLAGVAAPYFATTWAGTLTLGALGNIAQYGASQYFDNCEVTFRGLISSGIAGAISGRMGGRFGKPQFIFDTSNKAINERINYDALVGIARSGFLRGLGGSTFGSFNVDWTFGQ